MGGVMNSSLLSMIAVIVASTVWFLGNNFYNKKYVMSSRLAVVVRRTRPFAIWLIVPTTWLVHRLFVKIISLDTNDDNDDDEKEGAEISLLELLVKSLSYLRRQVLAQQQEQALPPTSSFLAWLMAGLLRILEDILAVGLLVSLGRIAYCLVHYSFNEWMDMLLKFLFEWSRDNIPMVQRELDQQAFAVMSQTGDAMLNKDPNRIQTLVLPNQGQSTDELLRQLRTAAATENQKWREGKVSGIVYTDDPKGEHTEFLTQVYKLYAWGNPLHPGFWPKMNQCEAEVIAMTANLLHAPTSSSLPPYYGCITSGGTESILLAVRAHLQYYGRGRSIQHPEIICGSTAHAALNKACEMFHIRLVVIDCDNSSNSNNSSNNPRESSTATTALLPFQLPPNEVRRRLTSNTIMIYASAPCYPQGVIDPIEQLSDIAAEHDIGLHVDACLGGFVLAFLGANKNKNDNANGDCNKNNEQAQEEHEDGDGDDEFRVPVFDFRNAGVTSMSADTHKFGYSTKGSSVVVYRSQKLRHGQYFNYPSWTGGMYSTPTFAGSRPGALSVCAWASMMSIGYEGYRQRARKIANAARRIAHGIQKIHGLELLTLHPFMVVCFAASTTKVDIYRVRDSMAASGWLVNELQHPASVHVCVTLNMVPHVSVFLRDLKTAVAHVQKEGAAGKTKGTAGIYGSVASLPDGPVECALNAFTDLALSP